MEVAFLRGGGQLCGPALPPPARPHRCSRPRAPSSLPTPSGVTTTAVAAADVVAAIREHDVHLLAVDKVLAGRVAGRRSLLVVAQELSVGGQLCDALTAATEGGGG